MREDFYMKFTQLLSNQMYTLSPSLVEICSKMTNLCYFNQDNPLFLSIPSVIFTGSLLVALKSQFVGDEMRMQTWRQTELLQIFGVTTIGSHSHIGSQAFGEDRQHHVDVFLWQLFPDGLQGDFQVISRLGFVWSLWYFSSMATQMW